MPDSWKSKSLLYNVYNSEKRGSCVTVILFAIIIGIFTFAYIAFGNEGAILHAHRSSLLFTSVVMLHGNIAPTFTYPNDPYKNDTLWLFGKGELTKKGRQNMYANGKHFRDRYNGFLSDLYMINENIITSADSDRCYMSAAVFLAGLYPPHKYQLWNPHILWQPIPIKTIPFEIDEVLEISKPCDKLTNELLLVESKVNELEDVQKELGILSDKIGSRMTSIEEINELYNSLYAQEQNGYSVIEFAGDIYPYKLLNYSNTALKIHSSSNSLKILGTGNLLNEIIININGKIMTNSSMKFRMYSVNELTVARLLNILNISDVKPKYCASVMFELHKIEREFYIEIYYSKDCSGKQVENITAYYCSDPCTLQEFIEKSTKLIPKNWEEECRSNDI